MSRITQKPQLNGLDLFQTTQNALFNTCVGEKFDVDGGESEVTLVYVTDALDAGVLVQAPAIVSDDTDLAVFSYSQPSPTAGTSGFTTVVVTIGSTAWTENEYQGGYMFVTTGAGMGQKLKVQSNTAVAVASGANSTVILEDTPSVALDNTSTVSFTPNPYTNVIINPVTPTNKVVGVSFYDIPALSFGLIGSKGSWGCLNDGGTAIGLGLEPSQSVPGAVATAGTVTYDVIGVAQFTGNDTEVSIGSFNIA